MLDCNKISPLVGEIARSQPPDTKQYLDWCFQCGEFNEYVIAFANTLSTSERKALIKCSDGNDQIPFKRLLFCLDKTGQSNLKLALLQFRKETKEQIYLKMIVEQKMAADELERIMPYLFKDRVLSCIGNFAYTKSQMLVGDS